MARRARGAEGAGARRGARAGAVGADLLRALGRAWGARAGAMLPRGVTAHLQAAAREAVLALAILGEALVRGVQAQARQARRRVERIPVSGAGGVARRARAPGRGRGRAQGGAAGRGRERGGSRSR